VGFSQSPNAHRSHSQPRTPGPSARKDNVDGRHGKDPHAGNISPAWRSISRSSRGSLAAGARRRGCRPYRSDGGVKPPDEWPFLRPWLPPLAIQPSGTPSASRASQRNAAFQPRNRHGASEKNCKTGMLDTRASHRIGSALDPCHGREPGFTRACLVNQGLEKLSPHNPKGCQQISRGGLPTVQRSFSDRQRSGALPWPHLTSALPGRPGQVASSEGPAPQPGGSEVSSDPPRSPCVRR